MIRYSALLVVTTLFSFATFSQDCQGSFDQQDIYGEDLPFHREFRCGTGMMQDRMHFQQMAREEKGYYEIEGLPFYDSPGYYKKNNRLYYSSHPDTFTLVPNGDVTSLEIVGKFLKDKNNVYANGVAQVAADAATFEEIVNSPYAKDKDHVYYNAATAGTSYTEGLQIVEGADPFHFTLLCDQQDNSRCYGYATHLTAVYFSGLLIPGADAFTFKLEENGYARDANFVYYKGKKLEGSDGRSFEKISHYYVKDDNNVYFYGELIPGMNGLKFKLLGESGMGTDGKLICFTREIIPNGDPATFVDLGCGYYKDINHVYSKGQILANIDAGSFELLTWGFTKDKNGVYCDDEIIPVADPSSFEVLGRKYSKDSKHAFYLRTLLADAKLDTFVADVNDYNRADDSRGSYERGVRTLK